MGRGRQTRHTETERDRLGDFTDGQREREIWGEEGDEREREKERERGREREP